MSKANRTAVAALVKWTGRHTLLVALPDSRDAKSTDEAVTSTLARRPACMVHTLPWDQSRKMPQ